MNEEEIINEIKKDREYYDIVEDLKQRNYSLKDVLRLFADTETEHYSNYDVACCIVYLLNLYKTEKEKNVEIKSKDYKGLIEDFEHGLYMSKFEVDEDYIRIERFIELEKELEAEKEKNGRLTKDNLDLDRLYRRTALHLQEKGKSELADYMLAQIGAVPTWTCGDDYSNWVCKDKVKAKIEEVKAEEDLYARGNILTILEELLEEE